MASSNSETLPSPCSILKLSTEILFLVIDYIPLDSHFSFASTCTRLATASRHVLQRHRDAYDRFQVGSDLDPATVPLLLRSAFGLSDPIPAWHLRSFEVWRDRAEWADWVTLDLEKPPVSRSHCAVSDLQVQPEDARHYLEWFRQYGRKDFEDEHEGVGLEQVEEGSDGLLKVLLFARCPRLRDLKFVTRSHGSSSCLYWLRIFISQSLQDEDDDEDEDDTESKSDTESESEDDDDSHSKQTDRPKLVKTSSLTPIATPWPTGFTSLRHVAVGITSGTWMDHDPEAPSTSLLAHLLRLPNITSIFFAGLRGNERDADYYNRDPDFNDLAADIIPPDCSSVQHFQLDGCSELDEFGDALFAAPRELLTVSFRYVQDTELGGATGIVQQLAESQCASLRSLMWYGYDDRAVLGDHCIVSRPEELVEFGTLKHVSVNIEDVELSVEHSSSLSRDWEKIPEDNCSDYYVRYVAEMFPEGTEVLVLWDGGATGSGGELALLDRAVARMITSGRYEHLQAIFLEDVERVRRVPGDDVVPFRAAMAAGLAAGIDVHTLTNRGTLQHSVDFPEPLDEYDLRTGRFLGIQPNGWVFDPYVGRRVPRSYQRQGKRRHELL